MDQRVARLGSGHRLVQEFKKDPRIEEVVRVGALEVPRLVDRHEDRVYPGAALFLYRLKMALRL
jgi:hypothetical protein